MLDRPSTSTVLTMAESPDPFLVVCGIGIGVAALAPITVGTISLVRQRLPVRKPAAWEVPRDVGWFALTMGVAQQLVSVTILAEELGVRGLGWGTLLASWVLGVAGCYRIIRYRRSRLDERQREHVASPFMIALRGYDMRQVDALLGQADEALASESETLRAYARNALRNATFTLRLRGYAPREVDDAIAQRLPALE
jgi:DivIVA domain-containing protein